MDIGIGTAIFIFILAIYVVIGICIFLPDSKRPKEEIKARKERKKKRMTRTFVNNLKRRLPWAERHGYGRRNSTKAVVASLSNHR